MTRATRIRLTAQFTTDNTGAGAFSFRGPNTGHDYIGTLSVPGSPAAAVFTVDIDDLTEITFYGTNPCGPLQLHAGGLMEVAAAGLQGNTVYQAVWPVVVVPEGQHAVTPTSTGGVFSGNISGTVTADQGSPNTIPNSWPVEVTDGTNVLFTPAHPGVVSVTGNVPVTVSSTVAVTQSGSWTVAATQSGIWSVATTPPANPGTSAYGQSTMTGSAVHLGTGAVSPGSWLTLSCPSTNAHPVFLGDSSVTTGTGCPVSAGQSIRVQIANANDLWAIGTASDVIGWLAT